MNTITTFFISGFGITQNEEESIGMRVEHVENFTLQAKYFLKLHGVWQHVEYWHFIDYLKYN